MKEYWEDMDIKIAGDPALQQAFRYNALQLLQSNGRGGKTNIAAKGLTGEFMRAYFWDTRSIATFSSTAGRSLPESLDVSL